MPNEATVEIAEAIIEDWNGLGYIKDPNILIGFLAKNFSPLDMGGTIEEVAKPIWDDLNRDGYYKDPKVLAEYLEGKLKLQ